MADSRSLMQEYRLLEQKRRAGTLTAAETSRHAELRDLVGFEEPAPARGGFDVGAAAAQLRESLLPAGLRSRPVEAPAPPAGPPPTEPEIWTSPEPTEPAPPPAAPADALFDPASLGQEVRPQAWNPEAPGYDPDAPYDEAAWIAAGYDPNATYDWSSVGGGEAAPAAEAAAPGELEPLELGEYDAAGAPLPPGSAPEPSPVPPPAPDGGGAWFDDTGSAPGVVAPATPPAFGEYDAPPPPVRVVDESSYGGPEGDSLPGGVPLDPGAATEEWLPEGALEVGFELASDGSFGEPSPPPASAPWSAAGSPAAKELWESPPALDLSTPFEPLLIPASRQARPAPPEPLADLEPEAELLEPIPEVPPEAPPDLQLGAAGGAGLESLPAEPAWAVPPAAPEPPPAAPAARPASAPEAEPVSLGDLDSSIEIDIPPEISAAYDLPRAAPPPLDFDAPAPAAAAPPGSPEEPELEPEPLPPPAGVGVVAGAHRVVIHTLDGQVLRGTLTDADLAARELPLEPGAPAPVRPVATSGVKAIFFMLAPGEQTPPPQGKRVRVAFRDGRQVAGFSPDYQEGGVGFFMIPADTRTNTRRIWVYQAAVKQVTVS